ncbi:MAG: hypothetical protein ABR499_11500 [Gemmatimonadaceae bacterium]
MAHVGARICLTLMLLSLPASCKDSTPPPRAGPPARIVATSGLTFTGFVGTVLETPLAVRVTDDQGRPVGGAVVRFSMVQGSGSVSPRTATTGLAGAAETRLTFGVAAGDYRVIATVSGVTGLAEFAGVATPGVGARVVVTPGQARLVAVGDTMRLRAGLYDAHGNLLRSASVTWAAADPDVFTVDQAGLVTGTKALSVGRAVASASGRADTAYVVVANPDVSPCLGYAAPVTLAVGQSVNVSMTDGACIASAGVGDEYVLIPWYGSTVGGGTVTLQVTGSGLAAITSAQSVGPAGDDVWLSRKADVGRSGDPVRGFELERRIREMGRREVMPRARQARSAFGAYGARSAAASRGAAIPANLVPGDFIDLNANAEPSCTSPTMRTGRVAAVSERAIVVHDTANPRGGFTDADYQRFATTFDTLVVPVNDAAFGIPTDIDGNGKVVIFFTRAVNQLTDPGASFYYGGFFHPRDLLPKRQNGSAHCTGSNEGEMFYMLVPDPEGVVNRNVRRVGFVDSVTIGTLAHEYQHLVNAGRRMYVNNAVDDEEVWLNEGLSHIAEELIFYRTTGTAPRGNIGGDRFGTQPFDGLFAQYMAPNFGRFRTYLQAPQAFSPYTGDGDLATRGAAWAFLRYAADRRGSTDGDVWMRLVNATSAGIQNLQAVFGADVLSMVRDWTVSIYTDDYVVGAAAVLTQPSWNFRTAYPALPASARSYPLVDAVRTMTNDVSQRVSLRGGGGAFLRFAVTTGREAAIRVTSSGAVPPAIVQATIVRRQ